MQKTTKKQDFINFAKANPLFMVSSAIYLFLATLIFGWNIYNFALMLLYYIGSLAIVFSSAGEKLLRLLEHVRKLETRQEKEYLLPIFDEVYEQAKLKNPELGRIEMCVVDRLAVNAYALGKHTIAVTKGAMQTFSEDQLKALIAHEIAHILYHDTIASLYAWIGNGIFTIFIVITKAILTAIAFLQEKYRTRGFWVVFMALVKLIFDAVMLVLMFLMQAVIAVNSRKHEYRADLYAHELGYGEELVEAFYLLEKISLGDNSTIIQKMIASHPRITARIEKIETLLDKEEAIQTAPLPLN